MKPMLAVAIDDINSLKYTEQRRKEAVIMHRWHQVEQSLGRKVSLEEAEDWPHSHDVFGRPM